MFPCSPIFPSTRPLPRFCSMRDNFQDLPTNRTAKRADGEPVRREGPHCLRVHRENAGLGTEQIAPGGGFQAELHPYL